RYPTRARDLRAPLGAGAIRLANDRQSQRSTARIERLWLQRVGALPAARRRAAACENRIRRRLLGGAGPEPLQPRIPRPGRLRARPALALSDRRSDGVPGPESLGGPPRGARPQRAIE